MDQGSQDRNLPASERKLKKARDDGQVGRSQDLSHLAVLGSGAMAVLVLAPILFDHLKRSMGQQLSFDASTVMRPGSMLQRLGEASTIGLAGCVAFAAIVMAAAILAAVASGGWVNSLKPLMPDFSRLNPLSGLANMFTKKKMLDTLKMLLITSVLFAIATWFLSSGLQTMASLIRQPSSAAIAHMTQWITGGVGLLLLVVFLAAMVDVPLQSFLHKDQMKMSHQEVKEESKESDGNPQLKGKIRQKQRELAQRSSVNAVPKADFVVMNPTHFAVAIRYDEKTMHAPRVVSKGADLLAMKIRDVAKQHSVPVLQSPMLARALYANAELDQDIPSALYTAVAQVLAYVYRVRAALRGEGSMPQDVPQPYVPPELDPQSNTLKATTA
ncbi:flagellar biosynthesis protein FlhB [Rhodoferax sp. TS-BS-61-7]|uniref:EscU/YscU/HrcU family type III secretion system export apparatus switch protein n=1 Tax=Rhodoferax sp. TS-BS-61-7 TaxID=2094194 RepID=UPI000CF72793|nr:EscU/YscU/HrcU family type III secretion system export apparatus switch protein [Rhodoferax sp. TS-BS-61-7]MBP7920454.1 EscU/YscU/HrcU family type III secretion system export apparatus switch protein [Limnohabitans sp.]PQA77762.1 flagellar biosynthetic protein FlhB [Rhodoferax sp. TS-BS-61-7]